MKETINGSEYNFAFLDEGSKREIRRAILHAIAVPGYQVPFGSRELPIGRGWGTGGIQLTMSLIGPDDILKVIDQGNDDSVNAVSIKRLISATTGVKTTTDAAEADIIQSRHRVPEEPLREDQVLVLQVPTPEPLRSVDAHEAVTRQLHADAAVSYTHLDVYKRQSLSSKAVVRIASPRSSAQPSKPLFDVITTEADS